MAMHLSGDWVTPRLNGQPFLEKPPLSLWLDAGAIRVFGATSWAVRVASAVAGLLSMLALYAMLRRFGRPATLAAGAAIMLATMASFWGNARQVGEDSLLSLGVTLALLAYFQTSRLRASTSGQPLGYWLLFALGIVIATLSKGVLGLALPGAVIFAYLVSESLLNKRLVLSDWLWPALITLLALLPLMVWLSYLYQAGGLSAVSEVLWANSIGRFSGSFEEAGHMEPFYYYLKKLPESFLPWNLLVYLGVWHFRAQLKTNRYLMFFSLWMLAQLALLTLASSKRMVYLMSMAPAAAVIAAEYGALLFERMRQRSDTSPLAATLVQHGKKLAFGVVALLVVSYLSFATWVTPREDQTLSFLPLTEQIHSLQGSGKQVVLMTPSERLAGAGVFYSQSLLQVLTSDEQLKAFLSESPEHVAVMERQSEPDTWFKVLDKVVVGDRAYYFLAR